jgi:hypothetical protein
LDAFVIGARPYWENGEAEQARQMEYKKRQGVQDETEQLIRDKKQEALQGAIAKRLAKEERDALTDAALSLSGQERKQLAECIRYKKDPSFLPGHALMVLAAKLYGELEMARAESAQLAERVEELQGALEKVAEKMGEVQEGAERVAELTDMSIEEFRKRFAAQLASRSNLTPPLVLIRFMERD